MPIHLCNTCGTSYPDSPAPPSGCPICEDERQFVPRGGQVWTTPEKLAGGHVNGWRRLETDLFEIHTHPGFGIGQRALLLRTPGGNILWDCIALLDDATELLVRALGGVQAIAISHPHFYTTMNEWAQAFNCPIHLNAADQEWIMRKGPAIKLWQGDTFKLWDGVTLVRCGGHFPGGTVVHWAGGAGGRGVVCAGDILTIAQDRKWLSFMRSYPNFLPLSKREVEHIGKAMAPYKFDVVYGHYFDRVIAKDAKGVLEKSVARYIAAIEGTRGY